MLRTSAMLLLIVAVAACSSKKDEPKPTATPTTPTTPAKTPPPAKKKTPRMAFDGVGSSSQVQIGGERRQLGFTITAFHTKQRQAKKAPWYQAGGTWTYIEAKTKTAKFTIGLKTQPLQGTKLERATAMLIVADKASVKGLAQELATALKAKPPADVKHTGKPLRLNGVVLGRDQNRTKSGYSGTGGGWVTSKLTIEGKNAKGKHDATEFYFNFNLDTKQGVCAEKYQPFNAFLIESIASRL